MKITSPDLTFAMPVQVASSSSASATEAPSSSNVVTRTIKVEISKEGQDKLKTEKAESEKYADIDRAPLSDDVKEALKNIRELQEKIAEKNEELSALLSDKTLPDDELKRKRDSLMVEIRSMQSAMGDATNALNNAMSLHNMDAKSRDLAKGLIGMK